MVTASQPMPGSEGGVTTLIWWVKAYLYPSRMLARRFPVAFQRSFLGRAYGRHLHRMICRYDDRNQSHATFFFRNRPELALMLRLLNQKPHGAEVDVAVVACSKGAEVYSIVSTIRSQRPDLKLKVTAIDISREIVDFAAAGSYLLDVANEEQSETAVVARSELTAKDQTVRGHYASMFERMDDEEITAMFDTQSGEARIKPWLKEGITWVCGDATDPHFIDTLRDQDVVVANRFLCHMRPAIAENCLRNLCRMVKPGGYIFASGVDLEVRTKVARDLRWQPVQQMIEEVHGGDRSVLDGWPGNYWALEPFSSRRRDWALRYACVFQVSGSISAGECGGHADAVLSAEVC